MADRDEGIAVHCGLVWHKPMTAGRQQSVYAVDPIVGEHDDMNLN